MLERVEIARAAAESLGAALMSLRGKDSSAHESSGGQLRTAADKAAEAWLVTYLRSFFPADQFLAEERFEELGITWDSPPSFWTVDALDGTRSFIEGFNGFCVQVAYIIDGVLMLGVIYAPVWQTTYWAVRGHGAYKQHMNDKPQRLLLPHYSDWPSQVVFADSTYPQGPLGQLMVVHHGQFLECGSIGLKICRVAGGEAHIFAKELTFKLWDVAPGELILTEAGGKLGLWDGSRIYYGAQRVYFENLVAAPEGLFPLIIQALSEF